MDVKTAAALLGWSRESVLDAIQIGVERGDLIELYDVVRERFAEELKGKGRTLRILTSFMYVTCAIGRKP